MIRRIIKAEMMKQRKNYYETWTSKISMHLWPVLICFSTYYTYIVFEFDILKIFGIDSKKDLLVFLVTGLLAYNWFWCSVQNARLLLMERANGTVEMMFLTPANRMALVYGRSLGGTFQNLGMYLVFTLIIIICERANVSLVFLVKNVFGFSILLLSGTIWGGFINTMYLVSRDVGFWFTVCDAPMNMLSGTSMPIAGFPQWAICFSYLFPLTFCLNILRKLIMNILITNKDWLLFSVNLLIYIFITKIVLLCAEKHNMKTGNFQLY